MLAGAVDPLEGLFVEQAHQPVAGSQLFHDFHGELVVVGGDVGGGVDGGQLMLTGSHLVVAGLGRDSQLPQLLVQFLHKGQNPRLDGTVVVVVQLLSLGRHGSEKGAASVD